MASLALLVTIIVLFTILLGPITYFLAKLKFPKFFIYLLSIISILCGISFCCIPIPVWYIGLIPIYFGYISIQTANKKDSGG
jgi:hypothetical protein